MTPRLKAAARRKLTSRQKFERWAKRVIWYTTMDTYCGQYVDVNIQCAWDGWKAAMRAKR